MANTKAKPEEVALMRTIAGNEVEEFVSAVRIKASPVCFKKECRIFSASRKCETAVLVEVMPTTPRTWAGELRLFRATVYVEG